MKTFENFYNIFCNYLDKKDKQRCISFVLDAVVSGKIGVVNSIEEILALEEA